jgi:hypothetical protein
MTATLAVRTGFRRTRMPAATERRVAQWAVQAVLPWALTVVHPSLWGLAAASAQLVLGGSLVFASGARLRHLARGSAVLVVAGNGVDLSHLLGDLAQAVSSGLEALALVALVSLVRGARRAR